MEAPEAFSQIISLYRHVLELSARQEACLQAGDLAPLPSLLAEKAEALAAAQTLTAEMQPPGSDPEGQAAYRAGVARVQDVLRELMAAEERCRTLVPTPPTSPPRRQVLAAYGAQKPPP